MDTNEKTLAIDWSACGVDPVGRTTMMWGRTPQRRSRWVDKSLASSQTS